MYSLEKAQLFSLKDVCWVHSIYYLFLLQFPALWSPVMTGRFCLDWIMAVKICGSPSPGRVQSPHQSPGDPLTSSHPSDPQRGLWLTQTCLLGVSRCPELANSRTSANNIPRVIIPSSVSKSVSSILFRIITKHYYSFSIWPPSPRQITIRSMLSMSRHSDGVTSPGGVVSPAWCLSADDPNSTILSPHETCFIIPALP